MFQARFVVLLNLFSFDELIDQQVVVAPFSNISNAVYI